MNNKGVCRTASATPGQLIPVKYIFKKNVKRSKQVGKDGVSLGLSGLLHRISFGLWPLKTPTIPPLFLRLTQSVRHITQSIWDLRLFYKTVYFKNVSIILHIFYLLCFYKLSYLSFLFRMRQTF